MPMSSVFSTPLVTPLLRGAMTLTLRLCGWTIKLDGLPPPPFVVIGAPHTSNWDFALMLGALLHARRDARWLGKDSLFRWPFNGLMRWLGGIPVDRSQPHDMVAVIAETLKLDPQLLLFVAPEGTRKKVDRWRTGFYFIALEAGVPIVMTTMDTATRQVKLLGQYRPTGDADREIREIQRHYRGFAGLNAANTFELHE
ncbi:MAG TPA: 1-acyl-sn-glycerol-3-phosphate acyltransferase [Candidatus Acidoferrum sp.]|nr:1-acyl-sn-glycerol-3-phosphate acyltransferase [Candidatus Acidoferrum sp.]